MDVDGLHHESVTRRARTSSDEQRARQDVARGPGQVRAGTTSQRRADVALRAVRAELAQSPRVQRLAQQHASLNGHPRLRALVQRVSSPVLQGEFENLTEEQIAAITRLQARVRGKQVREHVRVKTEAPGIIGTRIRRPRGGVAATQGVQSPLEQIQGSLDQTSTYSHLRVLGGASAGGVFGPGEGQKPMTVPAIVGAAQLPANVAVINGGYFAHNKDMKDSNYDAVGESGVGRPVGPTSTRGDHLPIPPGYDDDYGQVLVGDQIGVSSGPLLAQGGRPIDLGMHDDRFKYRISGDDGEELNYRNDYAGALTHASDRNARAAMSIKGGDVFLQTLTPRVPAPQTGATMAEWQTITGAGAGIGRSDGGGETLNLDGGGSVFMAITTGDGSVREIARGGRSGETVVRPVGNIIASRSTRVDDEQR